MKHLITSVAGNGCCGFLDEDAIHTGENYDG